MRVGLVILLILAVVSSLHICEFVVTNKFYLLTSVSDTDRGDVGYVLYWGHGLFGSGQIHVIVGLGTETLCI